MREMAMPTSRNSPRMLRKKLLAKKQWKAVQSKLSETTTTRPKSKKSKILETHYAIEKLKINYPNAHCELNFNNPFELLVATILSAQCTDQRVNLVTKDLFKKFPDAYALSTATLSEIEELIHSTGFYKNKAKNIVNCSRSLVQLYNGLVPRTKPELTSLSGVGEKTANVVLGNAFGISSGVVVDTHVSRLATRFGWTKSKSPEKIAEELEHQIPKEEWILISHLLIWHGRRVCKARNPGCESCFLFDRCPQIAV
jgi:endonuclease III